MSKSFFNAHFSAGFKLAMELAELEKESSWNHGESDSRHLEVLRRVARIMADSPKRQDKYVKHQRACVLLTALNELHVDGIVSDAVYEELYDSYHSDTRF